MKSPQVFRIAIAATIVCAAVFLLLVRKATVGRTDTALTYAEERQEPGARPSALPPSASGSNLPLNSPRLARQNDLSPVTDPKPAASDSANPMQTATRKVLDSPSFAAFAAAANLPVEKKLKIAEILALTQVNTESAKRSGDPTVRSLIPGRVRKDAEVRILLQLTKEQRDILAREHVMRSLLPEASPEEDRIE